MEPQAKWFQINDQLFVSEADIQLSLLDAARTRWRAVMLMNAARQSSRPSPLSLRSVSSSQYSARISLWKSPPGVSQHNYGHRFAQWPLPPISFARKGEEWS